MGGSGRRDQEGKMIRNQIAASVLVGAAVFFSASPAKAEEETAAPTFRTEQTAIDLGDVTAGSERQAVFVFHNDGDVDVRILRAKPS